MAIKKFAILLLIRMIRLLTDALIAIWKVLVKIELQCEANNKKRKIRHLFSYN